MKILNKILEILREHREFYKIEDKLWINWISNKTFSRIYENYEKSFKEILGTRYEILGTSEKICINFMKFDSGNFCKSYKIFKKFYVLLKKFLKNLQKTLGNFWYSFENNQIFIVCLKFVQHFIVMPKNNYQHKMLWQIIESFNDFVLCLK